MILPPRTAPTWFREALAAPVETGATTVERARITYRAWGPIGAPGVVLVHGGAAHARWWDHLGPILAETHRVVALDLSGHGDSDRRERYSMTTWAIEALGAGEAAGCGEGAVLVGHSLGGVVAFCAAQTHGDRVGGVVLIDSPLREVPADELGRRKQHASTFGRIYPERDAAIRRFRLLPDQPTALDYVKDHLAQTSVTAVPGGWSWKFDPRVFLHENVDLTVPVPRHVPFGFLRAEHGLVDDQLFEDIRGRLGPAAVMRPIARAGHHALVDEPLALLGGIRQVLRSWQHPAALGAGAGRAAARNNDEIGGPGRGDH